MKQRLLMILLILLVATGCRHSDFNIEQTEVITDLGGGTGTITWTKDKSYLISGFIFVNDGQVLTIEPGTVIRAKTGQGSLSSALIVARGGKIIAEGTSTEPIIFTVEGDDLEGSIPLESKGLWGGVILLGNAVINTESGEDMIEGIPISEPRAVYGGPDDDDNSGIFRYVSIRHGGTNIGEGNEINGLTLGGVGRQTIIDHIEVLSNADDGVEIFGGSVDLKNIIVAYCGDDAYDFDKGYHGKCQFLLGINGPDSDKGIECSGGLQPLQVLPGAHPEVYNITLFGDPGNPSSPLLDFFSYGAASIKNSLFINPGTGIAVSHSGITGDTYQLFENGLLTFENNLFYPGSSEDSLIYCYDEAGNDFTAENSILNDSLDQWKNGYDNPLGYTGEGTPLLPLYAEFDNLATYSSSWYEQVTYKGAFGSENWIEGWSLLYSTGLVNP